MGRFDDVLNDSKVGRYTFNVAPGIVGCSNCGKHLKAIQMHAGLVLAAGLRRAGIVGMVYNPLRWGLWMDLESGEAASLFR